MWLFIKSTNYSIEGKRWKMLGLYARQLQEGELLLRGRNRSRTSNCLQLIIANPKMRLSGNFVDFKIFVLMQFLPCWPGCILFPLSRWNFQRVYHLSLVTHTLKRTHYPHCVFCLLSSQSLVRSDVAVYILHGCLKGSLCKCQFYVFVCVVFISVIFLYLYFSRAVYVYCVCMLLMGG